MTLKLFASASLLVLLTSAVGSLYAIDLGFLDQAPLRFLTDSDTRLLDETITDVLVNANDGESRSWKGENSANSGTVTAVRSFQKDARPCRRLEVVTLAPKAAYGRGTSLVDICEIDGEWKILRLPH